MSSSRGEVFIDPGVSMSHDEREDLLAKVRDLLANEHCLEEWAGCYLLRTQTWLRAGCQLHPRDKAGIEKLWSTLEGIRP